MRAGRVKKERKSEKLEEFFFLFCSVNDHTATRDGTVRLL